MFVCRRSLFTFMITCFCYRLYIIRTWSVSIFYKIAGLEIGTRQVDPGCDVTRNLAGDIRKPERWPGSGRPTARMKTHYSCKWKGTRSNV